MEFPSAFDAGEEVNRSVKILHIHRRPFPGQHSIETLFASLRNEMRRDDCHVEPFVVPHHSKGLWHRVLNGWAAWRHRGDVNHITGDIHYVALLLPRNRTILTIHDCEALERLTGLRRWLLKLFWFDLPVRRARFVTVISAESKRRLQHHLPLADDKIVVIPDVISPIFRPCPRRFNEQCPRILQIGTKANKNLFRLVEALRGIRCHLHVVGRLSEEQTKRLHAAGIEFSNSWDLTPDQMYESYCQADMVSFVSTHEGFGLPILEANAVGRPVVTSNTSSMPEVAGDAACLVDPQDPASMRAGILRVLKDADYRQSLVRLGLDNVLRFRPQIVAERYLSLYRQLAAAPERHPAVWSPVQAANQR